MSPFEALQQILSHYGLSSSHSEKCRIPCPNCQDPNTRNGALAVKIQPNGHLSLKCFRRDCRHTAILACFGLTWQDMLPTDHPKRQENRVRDIKGRRGTDGRNHVVDVTVHDPDEERRAAKRAKQLEEQAKQPKPAETWAAMSDEGDDYAQDQLFKFLATIWTRQDRYRDIEAIFRWARNVGLVFFPDRSGDKLRAAERDETAYIIGISERLACAEDNKRFVSGGKRGLTYAPSVLDIPGPLYVCEGPSDTITLLAMGLCAIGRPSNVGGVGYLQKLLATVDPKRPIVILGENDCKLDRMKDDLERHKDLHKEWKTPLYGIPEDEWPGRTGALRVAEQLSKALGGRTIQVKMPPIGYKDVRAWWNAPQLWPTDKMTLGDIFASELIHYTEFPTVTWTPEEAKIAREVMRLGSVRKPQVEVTPQATVTLRQVAVLAQVGNAEAIFAANSTEEAIKIASFPAQENSEHREKCSHNADDASQDDAESTEDYDEEAFDEFAEENWNEAMHECQEEYDAEREILRLNPKAWYPRPDELCPRYRTMLDIDTQTLNPHIHRVRCGCNTCEECFRRNKRLRRESLEEHLAEQIKEWKANVGVVQGQAAKKRLTNYCHINGINYCYFRLPNDEFHFIAEQSFRGSQPVWKEEIKTWLTDTIEKAVTAGKYTSFYGSCSLWSMYREKQRKKKRFKRVGRVWQPIIACRQIVTSKLGSKDMFEISRPADENIMLAMRIKYKAKWNFIRDSEGNIINWQDAVQDHLVASLMAKSEDSPVYRRYKKSTMSFCDTEYPSMESRIDRDRYAGDAINDFVA